MTPEEFLVEVQKTNRLAGTYRGVEEYARARKREILRLVAHLTDDELKVVIGTRVQEGRLSKFVMRTVGECLHRELEGRALDGPLSPEPSTFWERLNNGWL